MSDKSEPIDPLDELADEFVSRLRRGENPSIAEYCGRYPQMADEIRHVFPTLVAIEHARPDTNTELEALPKVGLLSERVGDYRILREIARGGMGIVYEAEQKSLGRHVALKVLPPAAVLDERHVQRFQREARAAARLHHTNIVPVFGVGEDNGIYYYVMQFIDGLGLDRVLNELRSERDGETKRALSAKTVSWLQSEDDKLQRGVKLSVGTETQPIDPAVGPTTDLHVEKVPSASSSSDAPHCGSNIDQTAVLKRKTAEIASIMSRGSSYWYVVARTGVQIAEALNYAFEQGILHRDVKPSNLLLDGSGTVWVTDFGLAKTSDSDDLTRTGDVIGTLRYLAPERLAGKVDLRGDIYSLGVTLYEMLTLHPPFDDVNRTSLMWRIINEEPRRPRRFEAAIPLDLETIVLKAIAKHPAERYQTGNELAADLRRFLEDKPIAARRVSVRERLWRWCRRNPVVASLSAALVMLLVSALVILSISNNHIRRESTARAIALGEKDIALREKAVVLQSLAKSEGLARRRFYAAQMNLAGQAFERGQLPRVLDLLESLRPLENEQDLRGYEWYYLWNQIHRGLHVSFRNEDEVWRLAFSPDGSTLAVGGRLGNRGFLKLWDTNTGTLRDELDDGEDVVHGLDYSPDGNRLASGSADNSIRIWIPDDKRVIHRIPTTSGVRSLRWSQNGSRIAAGLQDGTVEVFDAESYELTATMPSLGAPVLGLAMSADAKRLFSAVAWGGPQMVTQIHDLTENPPRLLLPKLADRFVTDVSPDGNSVASYESGVLHIWDPMTQTDRLRIVTKSGWLNSVQLSSDGRRIATAGSDDRLATVWDCESGQPLVRGPHAHAVQVVEFDRQHRFWASATILGEVKIWHHDPKPEKSILSERHYSIVAASLKDGTLVLAGPEGTRAFDTKTSEPTSFPNLSHVRALSGDGHVVVAAVPSVDGKSAETIEVWEREPQRRRFEFQLPDQQALYYRSIALSRDGRWLATRSDDCPLRIWDISGDEPRPHGEFDNTMSMSLAFSPDSKYLAAGCQAGRVKLFDVERMTELPDLLGYESGSGWAFSVGFSPDGTHLASGNNAGVVRIWDVNSRQLINTLKGHPGEIYTLVYFPDNRRLAVASDSVIQMWDAEVGQELIAIDVPNELIRMLAVTADGENLISYCYSAKTLILKSKPR